MEKEKKGLPQEEDEDEESEKGKAAFIAPAKSLSWVADKEGRVLLRKGKLLFTWQPIRLCLKDSTLFFVELLSNNKEHKAEANREEEEQEGTEEESKKTQEEEAEQEEGDVAKVVRLNGNFTFSPVSLVSVTGKKHAFDIECKERGVYFLMCAASDQDRSDWLQALEMAASSAQALVSSSHAKKEKKNQRRRKKKNKDEKEEVKSYEEVEADNMFSVASYNVNFGLCDLSALGQEERSILQAIKQVDADVLCLQETTPHWEGFLRPILHNQHRYPHAHFHTFQNDEKDSLPEAGGIAVLSKLPIRGVEMIPSPVGWFPALLCKVELPSASSSSGASSSSSSATSYSSSGSSSTSGPTSASSSTSSSASSSSGTLVHILNLHLRPPLTRNLTLPWPASTRTPLPLPPALSRADRLKEVRSYAKHLLLLDNKQHKGLPLLVVSGDFNEPECTGNSVGFWSGGGRGGGGEGMGLHSCLAEFDPGSPTWWWPLPGGKRVTATYDHMFYNAAPVVLQPEAAAAEEEEEEEEAEEGGRKRGSRMECLAAKVFVGSGASDHFPIAAKFVVAQEEEGEEVEAEEG
ncbi:Neurofilament medium polypeptide [Balamuthia mandrillaris]